jgi:hypothetical protein
MQWLFGFAILSRQPLCQAKRMNSSIVTWKLSSISTLMVCCSRALPRSSLGGKKQEASFDNISWPAGVKFDPRGELCPLGGLFTPTVEDYRYEDGGGQSEGLHPLWITSPQGNKVHPWWPSSPLGPKSAPSGCMVRNTLEPWMGLRTVRPNTLEVEVPN